MYIAIYLGGWGVTLGFLPSNKCKQLVLTWRRVQGICSSSYSMFAIASYDVVYGVTILEIHCSRTCTTTQVSYQTASSVGYYSEPYSQNYGCGFWDWSRCSRTRYRFEKW